MRGQFHQREQERIEGPGVEEFPAPELDAVKEREAPGLEL